LYQQDHDETATFLLMPALRPDRCGRHENELNLTVQSMGIEIAIFWEMIISCLYSLSFGALLQPDGRCHRPYNNVIQDDG
jgi:hypothetical protein